MGNMSAATLKRTEVKSHMFQISFYHKYFDMDTSTFLTRIKRSLNPMESAFFEENGVSYEDDTELYGFIWITGTLIFLMFVSSTGSNLISEWLHSGKEHKKYEYDFELLTKSMILFYGYTLFVPISIYLVIRYTNKAASSTPSLTRLISIFSYSNVLWVPITAINLLIAIFVNSLKHSSLARALEWLIVLAAGICTGLSILKKLSPMLMNLSINRAQLNGHDNSKKYFMAYTGTLASIHLIFTVLVKLFIFGIGS